VNLRNGAGVLWAERGDECLGMVRYKLVSWDTIGTSDLYIYELFVDASAPRETASMLFQAVRDKARELGYCSVICHARPGSPMLRLTRSKRVEVDSYILRIKVNEK
jgi:hypothetical protein